MPGVFCATDMERILRALRRCIEAFCAAFSSLILRGVEDVEDASGVEDGVRGSAGLVRVGTHIAHKAQGFHRGF